MMDLVSINAALQNLKAAMDIAAYSNPAEKKWDLKLRAATGLLVFA